MSITTIHTEENRPTPSASGKDSQSTSWSCSASRLTPSRISAQTTPTTIAGTASGSSRRAGVAGGCGGCGEVGEGAGDAGVTGPP
ncbi:hypothetical protein ACFV1S_26575 [Streptomyces globisporus]|uniref:hypothetical protein n=1 Tax=Streptomyces TaxID=1883 RepID=UPI001F5222CB|nr:hypothetical protein [Streptomyces sp. TSRI0445]